MKPAKTTVRSRCNGQAAAAGDGGRLVWLGAWLVVALSLSARMSAGAELRLQFSDLPKETNQSAAMTLPGLPDGAKKLELLLVPGRGRVKPFFMGKYEVTQAQYVSLMNTNPSIFQHGPDHPVETMTWDDAKEFCRRLTVGLPGALKAQFAFRLPTDVEWSLAVGLPEEPGDTPMERGCKIKGLYPWGTEWPPPKGAGNYGGNFGVDEHLGTTPVSSFKPNRYGLYDLGGNVWEFCEDWCDTDQTTKALRGASCMTRCGECLRSSARDCVPRDPTDANARSPDRGFRVVLVGRLAP